MSQESRTSHNTSESGSNQFHRNRHKFDFVAVVSSFVLCHLRLRLHAFVDIPDID